MHYPPDLTPKDLHKYFPTTRPPIKQGAFELGLVLAGTLTAGAYTAGVLDYLLEALDAWQRAKEDDDSLAPRHDVVISTIAGASGGGINGAVVLRAAGWQFPHGPHDDNPLYQFWLGGSTLEQLLMPGPANGLPGLSSLLNCSSVDVHASETVEFTGKPLGTDGSPCQRAYLSDPLRLFVTVGNLSGVPYKVKLTGETGLSHAFCAHGDYLRFALAVAGGVPNEPPCRPDELALQSISPGGAQWTYLRDAALATSTIPVVFIARPLLRKLATSGYRVVAVPKDNCRRDKDARGSDEDKCGCDEGKCLSDVVQLVPDWPTLVAGERDPRQTTFLNVDGGVFNNDPFELVRTALAGFGDRNKRKPDEADRAVILIDPFSDPESLARPDQGSLASVAGAVFTALMQQARFKPVDIALAYAESVYSRFLIAPVGPGPDNKRTVGERAIASAALGGYGGFIDPRFAAYDFCLGRLNAYKFLAEHLALPRDVVGRNPIFAKWTPEQIEEYAFTSREDSKDYVPIIPLMRHLREDPPGLPAWPRLSAAPDLRDSIEARLQSVYELATAEISLPWWQKALLMAYLWVGWRLLSLRSRLRDTAFATIKNGLISHGLLAKPPP
jgi:hypothetical protein